MIEPNKLLKKQGEAFAVRVYDLGFSFFSLKRARRDTPDTFTTLNLTPGISPTACPFRPNPAMSTSSCTPMTKILHKYTTWGKSVLT